MAVPLHFDLPNDLKHLDVEFFDPRQAPFSIHGLYHPEEGPYFRRCPDAVAKATNEWVADLDRNTAGGRIRFTTDSPYILIHVEWPACTFSDNMGMLGESSFDLYEDLPEGSRYHTTFRMPPDPRDEKLQKGFDSVVYAADSAKKSYTLHMPLYNHVDSVYIGLKPGSVLEPERPYLPIKPVLYYGSSITQGGSASRPGMAYENIISRELNVDHINMGFSGSCRGEDSMVSYLLTLDVSVFVSDYDHNAPNPEHLDRTLRRMIGRFRDKKPELPIIMVSKPDFRAEREEDVRRREVVRSVYEEAVRAGAKNIQFVDGSTLFPAPYQRDCTIDGCHPNDLGLRGMANGIGAAVRRALGL